MAHPAGTELMLGRLEYSINSIGDETRVYGEKSDLLPLCILGAHAVRRMGWKLFFASKVASQDSKG